MSVLPSAFADLDPLALQWNRPDVQSRFDARYQSDPHDLRAFYDAVLPRVEEMLASLEGIPLGALDGANFELYRLLMSFAHAALAIERHGQPRAESAVYPTTLRIVQGPRPL